MRSAKDSLLLRSSARCLVTAAMLMAMSALCSRVAAQSIERSEGSKVVRYELRDRSPSEVATMLKELMGEQAKQADVIADDGDRSLTVRGPADVQKLSKQLIEQLSPHHSFEADVRAESPDAIIPLWPEGRNHASSDRGSSGVGESDFFSDPTIRDADQNSQEASLHPDRSEFASSEDGLPQTRGSDRQTGQRRWKSGSDLMAVTLKHIGVEKAETLVQRTLRRNISEISEHHYEYRGAYKQSAELWFIQKGNVVQLSGSSELVSQFGLLFQHLDESSDPKSDGSMRLIPLQNVDPDTLNRAIRLWRDASQTRPLPTGQSSEDHGTIRVRRTEIQPAGFQQADDAASSATSPGVLQNPQDDSPISALPPADEDQTLRRPSSDVTVEPLRDLDVLILRGRDPDVEELTRIIREIERLSEETAPEIEIVYLHHVRGEAMEELISDVLTDLTGPLQGRVSITPLNKPNALLLIGWGEAVNAAKKLIARLDESVEAEAQMELFALRHAPASQLAQTVEEFLNGRGGLGPDVNVTADERTNTLIVNASPRDLLEVRKLIERLDTSKSSSVNQAKIVTLKNALAADVSQTITQTLTAARGGTGATRAAALELLLAGPDGQQIVASGLLEDVKLTPDPRTNRILITGPPETVPLIEHLIGSLDETPAAAAQIKVFQVTNGDATDLVQVLRSLFPEAAATSTLPQLATAEGESSLVPVRFSVDVRTNSIIATGTAGDLKIIEVLLMRLDESDSQERVNEVYRLKNSPALDVANAVNNFLRSERVVNQAAPGRQNPFAQIESEVVVVPEPVGNALIISATPRYFEQIMDLVEGLDAQPPQVMIQVILAEVELDNLHEFGVELGLQDSLLFDRSLLGSTLTPGFNFSNQPLGNANTPQSLATKGKVGGQALSHFSVGRTSADTDFGGLVLSASSENVSVLLRAMNQSRNMEILSRPQIMTLDNQPAFIQVGQRVPRIVGTSINQVGQVNSVELENVGLILGVTPRISPEGMVVMEIDAEKSNVGPEIEGIPVSVSADGEVIRSPRVNITTAQTTVSAASGQTIVIGGLITNDNTTTARRVPWLSDVPVLGHLFRFDSSANNRKELLIILTPHVVRGESEAEYLKQVEMARMSWISCDIFNWMNTDTAVTGTLDSETVPTIYPDETPGVSALQQQLGSQGTLITRPTRTPQQTEAKSVTPGEQFFEEGVDPGVKPAAFNEGEETMNDGDRSAAALPAKVVVPKWRFQRLNDGDSQVEQARSQTLQQTAEISARERKGSDVSSDQTMSDRPKSETKRRRPWSF